MGAGAIPGALRQQAARILAAALLGTGALVVSAGTDGSIGAMAQSAAPLPPPRPDPAGPAAVNPASASPGPVKREANAAAKPAKELFGRVDGPAPMAARAIGFYSKGCLAGGVMLPVNGPSWQAMRLSRNRNWGHPDLVAFVERFATQVPTVSGWPDILVGDLAQPRGGPMLTGHASHQLGLDADIWLTPSPGREFTREEREKISATQMVRADRLDVDLNVWRPDHWKVIRLAASDPKVERVLVNAAIKKALCRDATGDRSWLAKVRPFWGHDYHMHIRIGCPKGSADCKPQADIPGGEGCGSELDYWFSDAVLHPKPPKDPPKPRPPLTLADLPDACAAVLTAK